MEKHKYLLMKKISYLFLLSNLLLGLHACGDGTFASEAIKSSVHKHKIQLVELQKMTPDGKAQTISEVSPERISYHHQFLGIDSTDYFNLARLSRYSIDQNGGQAKMVLILE